MAFVKRNEAGEVVAISQLAEPGMTEEVSAEDAEVKQFFAKIHPEKPSLHASDDDFIRVSEDVVELLIDKGVILFTELPVAAQDKMLQRRRLRSQGSEKLDLLDDYD